MLKTLAAALSLTALMGGAALADCAYKNEVPLKGYFAAFPAWKAAANAMKECGNFTSEHDQEIRTKGAPAIAAKPALYQILNVHNGTIVPVLNQNTIRPLDDLVARFGKKLRPNQLIKIDGKIMAVALMVNLQHLQYRKDIFDQLGIAVPKTYDELIEAAVKIKAAKVVAYPLSGTFKGDWNVGIEFNNFFVGYKGKYVNLDNSPAINSEAGIKALEMMKRLTEYFDPEYLSADATFVQQQFQQEKIAAANFWASRVDNLQNLKESKVVGKMANAPAPRTMKDGPPAVQYSWDGFAIPRNITDQEAEAAFRVAVEGAAGNPDFVQKNNDVAIWLIEGFRPNEAAKAAIDTIEMGAPPAPSTPWRGLVDDAFARNVPDYLLGKKTADETLRKIESDYTVSAREAGILKK